MFGEWMEQSRGGPKRIQSTTSFYAYVKKEITLIVSVGLVCTTGIGQGVVKFEVAHIREAFSRVFKPLSRKVT